MNRRIYNKQTDRQIYIQTNTRTDNILFGSSQLSIKIINFVSEFISMVTISNMYNH